MNELKQKLYDKCMEYVEERIKTCENALANSKDAGNEETKSSAGDKHETGRAMMQIEQETNSRQLQQALDLKNILLRIDPRQNAESVSLGSLVITNKGTFYIAISAGKTIIDNETYFLISNLSPVAAKLIGAKKGEERSFNGQLYRIEEIY
jgi:transcription elongation GreA/GreB family factor